MGSEMTTHVYLGADYVVSSGGFGTEENLRNIEAYRSGVIRVDDLSLYGDPFLAGRIDPQREGQEVSAAGITEGTRLEKLMQLIIERVLALSGVDSRAKETGLIVATTKGNIDLLRGGMDPGQEVYLSELARRVAKRTGFVCDPVVVSNACISGVSALIVAGRLIRRGDYRHVVVVGGDLLTDFVVSGFQAFKSVSRGLCRPYDRDRDGLTMGEACGALLLTADRQRALSPVVEWSGGGISDDANHISGPSRTGEGLCFAIRRALEESGIVARQIGFVNAHGTATVYNDEMESKAIAMAGLSEVPLTSLKPYFGHTLGAAGVIETIVCAAQLRRKLIYGTLGFEHEGVPCPVRVSARHAKSEAGICLKTASGFGGCNAALVLALEGAANPVVEERSGAVRMKASCGLQPQGLPFGEMIRGEFRALESPNLKFFKMDDLCKLGYVTAEKLLRQVPGSIRPAPERIALVLANRSSSLDTDLRHREILDTHPREGASPAVFVYTLANIVAGEICIRQRIQGETTFFVQDCKSMTFLRDYARLLLVTGAADAVICGWCELLGTRFESEFEYWDITK